MRFLISILLLPLSAFAIGSFGIGETKTQPFQLLNSGLGGEPFAGDGESKLLVGSTAPDGSFNGLAVAPSDFFDIVTLDTNSFSEINSVVYSKGLVNGGTYPSLSTNLYSLLHSYAYATNGAVRIIVGTAPSFVSAQLASDVNGTINPAAASLYPSPYSVWSVQWSGDGGNTWNSSLQQSTTPVLISVYSVFIQPALATNLTVTSYVNPSTVGGTNDLTAQTVLVTTTGAGNSVVNVGSAKSIAASATTLWANSPAVAPVVLNGNNLSLNYDWTFLTSNSTLIFRADGSDVVTFAPGIASGLPSVFRQITKSGTNLVFKLTASDAPTIQYETNLAVTSWQNLPAQTNWQSGGFWYVSAPLVATAQNSFFRAATLGTNTVPTKVSIAAQFFAASLILTNASGARFAVSVNSSTNGLTFTPAP